MKFESVTAGVTHFVDNHGKTLAQALENSGIYWALAVAQKCEESGYGTSNKAIKYNNFGGIKNFGSTPFAIGTDSNGFAIFSKPYDCFLCYKATLLSPNKKYLRNGLLQTANPYDQLKAIAAGGYFQANDDPGNVKYIKRVTSILNKVLAKYPVGKL